MILIAAQWRQQQVETMKFDFDYCKVEADPDETAMVAAAGAATQVD